MGIAQKVKYFKEEVFTSSTMSAKELWGYTAGIAGNTMGQDSTTTLSDVFERDFMGIENTQLQIKENVRNIFGFFFPPIAGAWYDSASHGKRSHLRKALNITPIPFALSSLMLFIVPSSSVMTNYVWAFVAGMVFSLVDTFYDIAMGALGLKLCENPKDRKNFFTLSSLAASVGSILPGWLTPIIVDKFQSHSTQQLVYLIMAIIFCVFGVTAMYMPSVLIGDKIDRSIQTLEKKKSENMDKNIQWNRETVIAIFSNRPFIVLQLSMLSDTIRQVTYSTFNFLYKDVLDDFGLKSYMEMISGTLKYIGLFAVPFIGNKVSARNILAGGYAYTAFFYALMSLFNINFNLKTLRKYKVVIGLLIGLAGMPNDAQSAARKIITADSTDYMEWYGFKRFDNPVRSDGMLTAAGNIMGKITALAKTNLYYSLFGWTGYQSTPPGSTERIIQTDKTLHRVFMMVSLCGLAGNTLSALVFLFDNFTGKRKEKIMAELEAFRNERTPQDTTADEQTETI